MEKTNYTAITNEKFSMITDTHFGRVFKEGVPLNRRGEYENKIISDFERFLSSNVSSIIIHGGDLFESPYVSNEVLMDVYTVITMSLREDKDYYFIAGNHDIPKDQLMIVNSSFYILSKLFENYCNVHFVFEPEIVEDNILLIPYSHYKEFTDTIPENVDYVIGHFEDPVPANVAYYDGHKYSGHFHKRHITPDGTFFIGSFYPIAFGEETGKDVMETMTLEEYHKRDEEELKDKRIRIILKDGEELPVQHPCLQLIGKKEIKEDLDIEVKSESDFDFKELFYECLKDCKNVDELWRRYLELKND